MLLDALVSGVVRRRPAAVLESEIVHLFDGNVPQTWLLCPAASGQNVPPRERERDSSSCSNGSSWAARAVLMRLTRAPRPSGQVGARVSDLLARPLGPPRVNEGSGVIGHLVVAVEPSALLASRGQWGNVRPPARSVAAAAAVGLKGACPATFPFNNGERTCPATLRSTTASLLSIRGAHRHSTPASGHVGPFFRSTIAGGDVLPPPPHRSRGA